MSRATRRHPPVKQQAKAGRARAAQTLGRAAGARAAPREGRSSPLSWRPRFVMDIVSELRKVVWPTRETTLHLTVVVIIVSLLIGAALGGIDIGFGWLIDHTLLR